MQCLTAEQFDRLFAGEGASGSADDLHLHLAQCTVCQRIYEEQREHRGYRQHLNEVFRSDDSSSVHPPDGHGSTITFTPGEPAPPSGASSAPITLPADAFPGYRIVGKIGGGAQGDVYQANQISTDRTVALKVLREGPLADPASRARFEREVHLSARFRHPNIVPVLDSGIAEGRYFFAMDYICGRPLDEYVRNERMRIREVVNLFAKICDAVCYAHRRGVIHRDLKPSNILVTEEGVPYVLDFGLAKPTDRKPEDWISLFGQVVGTLRYMSPEQTRGDLEEVDTRADVYSLGVILYELLTGRPPYTFGADWVEAMERIRTMPPNRPSKVRPGIDSDLDAIVLKALEKEPEMRYRSADEFAENLSAWLDGRPLPTKSTSSLYVLRKLLKRHRYAAAVAGLVAVIVVATASIAIDGHLQARKAMALKAESDRMAAGKQETLNEMVSEKYNPVMPRANLGWFLAEWYAGRIDQARYWQSAPGKKDGDEYKAMSFLLDDTYRLKDLLREMNGSPWLAYFVAGEREAKAGRYEEAIRMYRLSLEKSDPRFVSSIEARLKQLEAAVRATGGSKEVRE